MKINVRFVFAAVLIASIAALGINHGAWAKPADHHGTVPPCQTSDTRTTGGVLKTCSSLVTVTYVPYGGSATVTEINPGQYGKAPKPRNFGPGVNIVVLDRHNKPVQSDLVIVCFPDPTGKGLIYYWLSQRGWVLSPTYHDKKAGLTCTLSWFTGVFAIAY